MKACERFTHFTTMMSIGTRNAHAFEEGDNCGGTSLQLTECLTVFHAHRTRAVNVSRCEMVHETDEKRQVFFFHTLLIKRQNEIAAFGMKEKI